MSNVFQTCFKGFNLKKLVVEPKTAQPVDSQLNRSRSVKQPSLSSRTVVQPVKVEPQSVDPHLNFSRSGQGAVKVQWSPAKHYMLTASQPVEPLTTSLTFFLYKKALIFIVSRY